MVRVKVFWNSTRKCWSVWERGKEPRHVESVCLLGCTFKVQASGRARVLRTGVKYLHAWIIGEETQSRHLDGVPIGYNPRKGPTFSRLDTGESVSSAKVVQFGRLCSVIAGSEGLS